MARLVEERWVGVGFDVVVEQLPVADERGNVIHDALGVPKTEEHTTLVLILNDPGCQRIVRVPFGADAKQTLLKKLTGGIIVAGNGGTATHLPFGKGV